MGTDVRDGSEVVRFDAVGYQYAGGPAVLEDISFSVPAGGFRFVTGPSGAGKTTLLRLMALAMAPTRGRATILGEDVAGLPRRRRPALRRRIGVVFQDFRLISHLSAFDNVALPLRLDGVRESTIRSHVTELLNWVGLGARMNALPATLSGGQQQLVAVARAVISGPQLLIADEPAGSVDERAGTRLLHLFGELNRLGTAVVVATHSSALIAAFSHPCLHLRGGRLIESRSAPAPAAAVPRGSG